MTTTNTFSPGTHVRVPRPVSQYTGTVLSREEALLAEPIAAHYARPGIIPVRFDDGIGLRWWPAADLEAIDDREVSRMIRRNATPALASAALEAVHTYREARRTELPYAPAVLTAADALATAVEALTGTIAEEMNR